MSATPHSDRRAAPRKPLLTFTESLSRRRKPKRQKRTLPAGASLGDDQTVKKRPPRVHGPYAEPDGYRIIFVDGETRKSLKFPTQEEADTVKARLLGQIRDTSARTIGQALDEFEQSLLTERSNLPQTARHMRGLIASLLPVEESLKSLTPDRAAALYRAAGERLSYRGTPLTPATLSFLLKGARRFASFCIERGYLTTNPFEKLRTVGKISTGKTQLTADEARRFMNTALQRVAAGHPAALAAALQLALGLRSSEVLNRRVRDLDEGATVLLIPHGKTKNARRRPVIPPFLRPHLEALAANGAPDAYLFGAGQTGNPHMTSWLVREVRRICEQAAVPAVCPHSLRGLHATLAMREGVASHAVASALGHGSFSITARHYVDPTQLVNTRVAAVMTALGQDNSADPKAALSEVATTLIDHFAGDQIEDLITLLRSRKTA